MYVVKVVIGANCAQGGPEKGGFSIHLILSSLPGWRLRSRWAGIAVLHLQNHSPQKQRWCLDYCESDDAGTNKVRGVR
jgi:hypothetical protein